VEKAKRRKKTPEQQLKAADKMVKQLRLGLRRLERELGGWRNKKC